MSEKKLKLLLKIEKLGQRLFLWRTEQALKENLRSSFLCQHTYKDVADILSLIHHLGDATSAVFMELINETDRAVRGV